jgi:hypothetical protein
LSFLVDIMSAGWCSTPSDGVKRGTARALDACPPSTHNVLVRLRLILIVIALVVLAFVGLRQADARAPHTGSLASSQLSTQPAPDPEPPAIVKAAVTASATAQTYVACEPRGQERHAQVVPTDGRQPLHEPAYGASLPQSFPLLI